MMMMMMVVMQMLISVTSCNVNAADNDLTTPLVMAALQGNAVICETLVRKHNVIYSLSVCLSVCLSLSLSLSLAQWCTTDHIQGGHQNLRHFGTPKLHQILIGFQPYFTVRIVRKSVVILSLKIPPHLKCVATLPCEVLVS